MWQLTLMTNLVIAAALYRAYKSGYHEAMDKAHWGPGWD